MNMVLRLWNIFRDHNLLNPLPDFRATSFERSSFYESWNQMALFDLQWRKGFSAEGQAGYQMSCSSLIWKQTMWDLESNLCVVIMFKFRHCQKDITEPQLSHLQTFPIVHSCINACCWIAFRHWHVWCSFFSGIHCIFCPTNHTFQILLFRNADALVDNFRLYKRGEVDFAVWERSRSNAEKNPKIKAYSFLFRHAFQLMFAPNNPCYRSLNTLHEL